MSELALIDRIGRGKVRFLLGGAANTLMSYGAYLVLLQWWPYRVAFTAAYVTGIIGGYAINTLWVFRKPWSWRALLAYPLIPILTYFASLMIVQFAIERAGVDECFAPLISTVFVLPLSFVATRWLIHRASTP